MCMRNVWCSVPDWEMELTKSIDIRTDIVIQYSSFKIIFPLALSRPNNVY